jgi:hypothetical protein
MQHPFLFSFLKTIKINIGMNALQFGQCQDAQTPNKPVSKQPTFIMSRHNVSTFKATQRQNAQF